MARVEGGGARRRMNVLMLTNTIAPDALGGLDRYVRELSAALVAKGLAVDVVTKLGKPGLPCEELGEDGVRIHRFPLPPKTHPLYALRYGSTPLRTVRRRLRSHPDAVVHGHFAVQSFPVTFARRPFLSTFHSPVHKEVLPEREFPLPAPLERPVVAAVRAVERRVVRSAVRNVVLSEFMRGQLAELSADAARDALVLPGGIDVERFCPGEGIAHPWVTSAAPLLFTARRFVGRTGVLELVHAMASVVRELPGARLAVAGAGPLEARVRQDIARLGLSEHVALLGRISDEDLVRWYRSATLVVMPTQELEGFGLTSAEAMACGTPVVGTPAGAVPEVIRRLDARLVTESVRSEHIAAKLVEIASQNGLLADLAAQSRDAVVPAFGWPTIAQATIAQYEALLSRVRR